MISPKNIAKSHWLTFIEQLGSLLSYGLAHIASQTLYPYQIIFLFCGLLTGMLPFRHVKLLLGR